MKIIIDTMGGDKAPQEIVLGALQAFAEYGCELVLVGDEQKITEIAVQNNYSLDSDKITVVHTSVVIAMDDSALSVIRDKSDSSMSIGLRMLAEGKGDAFVSAGNTGALHAGSSLLVRRIKGIQRSAIATVLPFERPVLLIDSGANTEVEPSHMRQFAIMGSIYMNKIFSVENPQVGLLNNGTERTKGTKKLVEAYDVLEQSENVNFVGNVESKEVPFGKCDVLVTDGFTGNVFLKTVEGLGSFLLGKLKDLFYQNLITKVSALPMKKGLKKLKHDFDAAEYGGAPLLGLSKPVIKAHGGSDARAMKNAIRQAVAFAERGIILEIHKQIVILNAEPQKKSEESAAPDTTPSEEG